MTKKIHVSEVKLGMFIHEICANWLDHPFWNGSFALNSIDSLTKLKASGIKYVWIDVSRGIDVEPRISMVTQENENRKIESVLHGAIADLPKTGRAVAIHEEIDNARKVLAKAQKKVEIMLLDARMGKALQIEDVMTVVYEINRSVARNSNALLSLVRLKNKDNYTYMHSVAVCALMMALGKQLGIRDEQLPLLGEAGLFHDIGKAKIPETVLNKPGKLTDEEFTVIKQHPRLGWRILKQLPGINDLTLDVALHHHEKTDGTGYPDKLSGESLSLAARMGAICDVYDAITSERCYKNAWEPAEAIRKIASWQQNGHFDKKVFHAFVKTVGIYPVGTLVKLKSGRLGVVVDQTEKNLTTPIVKVFFSIAGNMHIFPEKINMAKSRESIESSEDPTKWGFNLQTIMETNS
ncbi:HD-GYP domain-containing protein [Candidatus Methylospira mobilis]|uniref:HD-GYP domain-containing protein n=1 Tax=Candidatus Methylospira mobilis TaxID=1808979 RepID=A0A5Q0BHN5_9GAMM|nr:HD-GYP domain-containing protein [Candidatus Methylospira mobilis]QFY43385.1 HD-GYP domain-containing protein [Candidatus Methylospira mobilis]